MKCGTVMGHPAAPHTAGQALHCSAELQADFGYRSFRVRGGKYRDGLRNLMDRFDCSVLTAGRALPGRHKTHFPTKKLFCSDFAFLRQCQFSW